MKRKGNYGIDSPGIVATLSALGTASVVASLFIHSGWRRWVPYGFAGYFFLGASGMLFYSKVGKLGLCERLLGESLKMPSVATWWCGEPAALEAVIDKLDQLVIKPSNPSLVVPVLMAKVLPLSRWNL